MWKESSPTRAYCKQRVFHYTHLHKMPAGVSSDSVKNWLLSDHDPFQSTTKGHTPAQLRYNLAIFTQTPLSDQMEGRHLSLSATLSSISAFFLFSSYCLFAYVLGPWNYCMWFGGTFAFILVFDVATVHRWSHLQVVWWFRRFDHSHCILCVCLWVRLRLNFQFVKRYPIAIQSQ